jgi:sialic acid synthase SpsE
VNIEGRDIGSGHSPYVVAEIAGEHKGSYSRCCELMAMAKEAGADAVKAQLYDPVRLAEARGGRDKVLTEGLWKGRTLSNLYQEAHTPREWFSRLFSAAKQIGITLFSSVFDEEGVEYLESLGCPAYKIASFELADLALIRKAASTGKPVIISTGMAETQDVAEAFEASAWKREAGWAWHSVALLHCISSYPCKIEDANLMRVKELADDYGVIGGLSDHTLGSIAPVVATALGASIIEKHVTLDRNNGGPDAPFSLEPREFKQMVQDVKDAYASLGTGERPASEEIYRELRRTSA